MYKGQPAEELFLTPYTSIKVYIDQDDVAMCKMCSTEDGVQVCSVPTVISMGPVTQIVGSILPGERIAVAYLKIDGAAYVRKGHCAPNEIIWEKEMGEEECWVADPWPLRN